MKKLLLSCLMVFFVFGAYSQTKNATRRSAFDDAAAILKTYQDIEGFNKIAADPARVSISQQRQNTEAKKKARDEIRMAGESVTTSRESIGNILSFYFNDAQEIKAFNAKYGFSLPEDIAAARTKGLQKGDVKQYQIGPNPTQTIDAIATFMADRFKKEINIAFLDKFRKHLDSIPELGKFFPLSRKVLDESDPYNYTVFIGTLRQACEQDLANIQVKLPQILAELDLGRNPLITALKEMGILINVSNLTELRAALNTIAQSEKLETDLPRLHKEIGILAFTLNAATKFVNGSAELLDTDDLKLIIETDFLKYYLPLLVRQNEGYLSNAGLISPHNITVLQGTMGHINEIVGVLHNLEGIFAEIDTERTVSGKTMAAFITSVDKALEVAESEGWFGGKFSNIRKSVSYIRSLNEAIGYIENKQYGLALMDITDFILEVSNARLTQGQKTLIKKYSGFMADMLNAKSKDELFEALENSANPVGSYRVKRNSTFNVSLNGYAGGFYGVDMKGTSLYGFTAPVGIYAGWGNISKKRPILANDNGKSLGLFVPLIDVGAVASFRLKDSETDLADVSWDNVFAPGAYLTYGFGKCPVSVNLGGQMGPALKSVAANGTAVIGEKEWFWRASVVIDIPVFDFYTKQKEYKIVDDTPVGLKPGGMNAVVIPGCAPFSPGAKYSAAQIQHLFDTFMNSPLFDWKDANNCEDRANAVCKILSANGYKCGKAWLFRENPNDAKEKNAFIKSWAYHVAAYMEDENGNIMIIDPALFYNERSAGDLQQWADKVLKEGRAHYILTDPSYYMHKKGQNYCSSASWETDAITDENSKTISGLAGLRGLSFNKAGKREDAWREYRKMLTGKPFEKNIE